MSALWIGCIAWYAVGLVSVLYLWYLLDRPQGKPITLGDLLLMLTVSIFGVVCLIGLMKELEIFHRVLNFELIKGKDDEQR